MGEYDTFKALQGYTYDEVLNSVEDKVGKYENDLLKTAEYAVYLYCDESLRSNKLIDEAEIVTRHGWTMSDYINEFFARKKIV